MHFVVGGRGLIGAALVQVLMSRELQVIATARGSRSGFFKLDLNDPLPLNLPSAKFVYLVAAIPKLAYCEQHPAESWRVNVDAPIALAKYYRHNAFVTFVSSDAVETCANIAYGRQKAAAEAFMHTIDAAIVRPSRVPAEKAPDLAEFLVHLTMKREIGVHRWTP